MKATFLLRREHVALIARCESLLASGHADVPLEILRVDAAELRRALDEHMKVEEEVFYPACETVPELRDLVRQAREEHRSVRALLRELDGSTTALALLARVKLLAERFEEHVEDEEEDLFPRVRRVLGEARMEQLGVDLVRRRSLVPA